MKCINCNVELPANAAVCPMCGAKVTTDIMRCPKCFVKLEKGAKTCKKCGCNIKKALEEEKAPALESFEINKKQLVIASILIVAIITVFASVYAIWYITNFKSFSNTADDYITELNENIETITMLAEEYNKIYNGQWLVQAERATALERKFKEEISILKDNRDTFTYNANELASKAVNDEDAVLIKALFKSYDNCYIYVVGKKGKYPGYMSGYNEMLKSYEENLKTIKKRIN